MNPNTKTSGRTWLATHAALTLLSTHALADARRDVTQWSTNINPGLLYWKSMVLLPALKDAERDHMQTNIWQGRALDEQVKEIVSRYGTVFSQLEHAAAQKVPCDWGDDLKQGPHLLLPGLGKAKFQGQVARLRFRWHLEAGRAEEATREWNSAFCLARQVSTEGILISALVGMAMENILISGVAENWFRLDNAALEKIEMGMDAAPKRGKIERCVATERTAFRDWVLERIAAFKKEAKNEADLQHRIVECLNQLNDSETPNAKPFGEEMLQACGGTVEGIIKKLNELTPVYESVAAASLQPYTTYAQGADELWKNIETNSNPLTKTFISPLKKSILKEFTAESRLAVLRAAIAFKKKGEPGLGEVIDPLANAPFQLRRVSVNGVNRGFELRSSVVADGLPLSLIFLESDGPAIQLDGAKAGTLLK